MIQTIPKGSPTETSSSEHSTLIPTPSPHSDVFVQSHKSLFSPPSSLATSLSWHWRQWRPSCEWFPREFKVVPTCSSTSAGRPINVIVEIYYRNKGNKLSEYDIIDSKVYVSKFQGLCLQEYCIVKKYLCDSNHTINASAVCAVFQNSTLERSTTVYMGLMAHHIIHLLSSTLILPHLLWADSFHSFKYPKNSSSSHCAWYVYRPSLYYNLHTLNRTSFSLLLGFPLLSSFTKSPGI